MKVSIIIPAYNEEKVIGRCLLSLDKQSIKSFEVILVDDGSTDGTLGVANALRINNYKLRIKKQRHKGPGEARNLGVSVAKGKVLVFIDADMTFDKDFIKKLVQPILNKKSKGTFSKEEYIKNWESVWAKCWNINEGWPAKMRHPKNYPDKQKVFRAILKSEFDRVGGFDKGGHYTDDYLSEKLGYESKAVKGAVFYHENPDSLQEIFTQAKWASKRKYRFGIFGAICALLRSSLPVSIVVGVIKSILNFQPLFLVFKVVYDLGAFFGIIEFLFYDKGEK